LCFWGGGLTPQKTPPKINSGGDLFFYLRGGGGPIRECKKKRGFGPHRGLFFVGKKKKKQPGGLKKNYLFDQNSEGAPPKILFFISLGKSIIFRGVLARIQKNPGRGGPV